MKRIISLLLAILTVCTLTIGMSGCGGASKSAVVGVWEYVGENKDVFDHTVYMYVYEDGTGEMFSDGKQGDLKWEIDGEYFVRDSETKYTIKDNGLYDRQGNKEYEKISNDTSVDIEKQ